MADGLPMADEDGDSTNWGQYVTGCRRQPERIAERIAERISYEQWQAQRIDRCFRWRSGPTQRVNCRQI